MDKLPMCRICLVQDVRMYVVVNKNLHELYEKLTDVPFVTEDRRPMLACFFCCTKLKQCCRFLRKCLEAEELFTEMMNEDYERHPLIKPGHLEFLNGFSYSPIELISIVGGGQTESDAIKEEFPEVGERLDNIIDPEEQHQTDKLGILNVLNSYTDGCIAHHAESDSEDDVPLTKIKTEVVVEPESIGVPIAKKPKPREKNYRKLSSRTTKFKESFTKTQHGVNSSINNTTSFRHYSNRHEIECKISNKGVDSDDIKRYRRVCAKDKRYKCVICQRSFSKNSYLKDHIRTHTGEKPFKCDICQRSFSVKSHLSCHFRTHTGEKPFKCDICQHSFTQNSDLTKHTRTHTGEKPYKCDVCQRSFRRKPDLVSHFRTHSGEKPFKCNICQRSFSGQSQLSCHIRSHTGEKPFKCDICQHSFTQKGDLIRHTRTHTGEKPFKCDICQRSFPLKNRLVIHTRTHTGEKPFKCDMCPRSFGEKGSLTKHTRKHDGEKS